MAQCFGLAFDAYFYIYIKTNAAWDVDFSAILRPVFFLSLAGCAHFDSLLISVCHCIILFRLDLCLPTGMSGVEYITHMHTHTRLRSASFIWLIRFINMFDRNLPANHTK